jgi:hypothetical protein
MTTKAKTVEAMRAEIAAFGERSVNPMVKSVKHL